MVASPERTTGQAVFGLRGRRAVVTGHRGGIGGAVATLFEAEGAEVIGLDLPDFDLSDISTLEARAAALIAARGPVDILVNCAGVTVLGSVLETPPAEVEQVFRVNFIAPYTRMRAVRPGMIARKRGAIVNLARMRLTRKDFDGARRLLEEGAPYHQAALRAEAGEVEAIH